MIIRVYATESGLGVTEDTRKSVFLYMLELTHINLVFFMTGNQFIPKMSNFSADRDNETADIKVDSIGNILKSVTEHALIVLVGLVPLFFTAGLWASLGFDKVIFTILFALIALVSISLLALRKRSFKTILPLSLITFWFFVAAALASGLLSGDVQDAIRGRFIENQTVAFFAVLALAMSAPLFLQNSKLATSKALSLFSISAALILIYNLIRIIFGPAVLPLGSFGTLTASPVGGLNDLAIFSAIIIIFGLITLVQLPLKKWLQFVIAGLIVLSVVMLAVVNFFNVWLIICFFSFLMLLYLLSRDTIFKSGEPASNKNSQLLIFVTTFVCVVSVVFVIAGDYAGAKISNLTGINYVEVRPSQTATYDIARAVYSTNALLGVGPNKFTDAWKLHKNENINQTIFWDTEFSFGNGFVQTLFVNLGLLGGVLFVLFSLSFVYLGYRLLIKNTNNDFYWYYLGSVSFAVAAFIWLITYIYNPGTTIMIIGALFTGLTFTAAGSLLPESLKTIPLVTSRKSGFLLISIIIIIVTASVMALFSVGKQYVAQANFNKAQVNSASIEDFQQVVLNSYSLYPDDVFYNTLAQVKISNINSILTIQEPTEAEQQLFLNTAQDAVQLASAALENDVNNPLNQIVLASVYNSLATAGIEGAEERAFASLEVAKKLDPLNPGYHLIAAQMAFRVNKLDTAREEVIAALNLKRNFTQALYLLAQIEVIQGNTESAISATQAIITLEPNNPTRYLQLGLLESANNNSEVAIKAYETALKIDTNYANARYLLAVEYIKTNRREQALNELKLVAQTNQENVLLSNLINQLETGVEPTIPDFGLNIPVKDNVPQAGFESSVTTDGQVDTNLVSPVNTISDKTSTDASSEANNEVESDATSTNETSGSVAE